MRTFPVFQKYIDQLRRERSVKLRRVGEEGAKRRSYSRARTVLQEVRQLERKL
jgi:hypothetical protein